MKIENPLNRAFEYGNEIAILREEVACLKNQVSALHAQNEANELKHNRAIRGIKIEADGYLKDHMKMVNWLCDNGFGESCRNPADTVLDILELSLEKLDVQENYIQASVSMGQRFAQDYSRDMRKLNSEVDALKKCL